MPVTSIGADHLAAVASEIRKALGYSTWDVAGVRSKIRDIAHLEYPDVAMAVIRAAADPDARTPGVIPKMDGPHWRERITDPGAPARIARDDWCRDCGQHRLNNRYHGVPTPHAEESGIHPFVHVDSPRPTSDQLHAARVELRELLRYVGRTPDPDDVCDTATDDASTTDTDSDYLAARYAG